MTPAQLTALINQRKFFGTQADVIALWDQVLEDIADGAPEPAELARIALCVVGPVEAA